jgi:hypothetical protein
LIFFSTATRSVSCSAASRRRGLPGQIPGTGGGEDRLGLQDGDVLVCLSGSELGQQTLQPVHCLHSLPSELLAAVSEHPQRLELDVIGQHPQVLGADRHHRNSVRIVCVGLSVVPGVEQPRPSRQLGRHIDHLFTVREQLLRQRPARAVAAFDSPHPFRPSRHRLPHRGVAGLVRAEPARGQHDLVVVDDLDCR